MGELTLSSMGELTLSSAKFWIRAVAARGAWWRGPQPRQGHGPRKRGKNTNIDKLTKRNYPSSMTNKQHL